MPSPSNNGHSSEDRSPVSSDRTGGIEELLSEAESLRQSLSRGSPGSGGRCGEDRCDQGG